jgi:hypothetical protein
MRVFCASGTFLSQKIVISFNFKDGQSVPKNEDVLSQICRGCFAQGLLCPKDGFVPGTFNYKISGTKNS